MRAGNERSAGGDVDRPQIVGLELAAGFINQPPRRLEIGFRLEQCLRRNDDFLAGVGKITRQPDPVGDAQLLRARTDELANVNRIDRLDLRHLGVELEDFLFRPEVEQWA